jgi:hypothetical protein
MVGLTVVVTGVQEVRKNMKKTDIGVTAALEREKKRHAFMAERQVKKAYRRRLKVRSGTLIRSVTTRSTGKKSRSWEVGTPVKYAKSHEEGAIIRPHTRREIVVGRTKDGRPRTRMTTGRMLAIPVGAARTMARVAKGRQIDKTALDLSKGQPFTTFVSKSGKAIMLSIAGKPPEPIAALVSKTHIRGKRVFGRVTKLINRVYPRNMQKSIQRVIRKNGGA